MNFTEFVEDFSQWGSELAIAIPDGPQVSYRQLREQVLRLVGELPLCRPGFPVAVAHPNGLDMAITVLALMARGDLVTPINYQLPPLEFANQLRELKASAWFGPTRPQAPDFLPHNVNFDKLGPHVTTPGEAETPCLFLHTSGTTNHPRGVALNHRQLLTSARAIADCYQLSPTDRTLLVMPLFHVHGLVGGFLATLASGGAVVMPERFSASKFWRQALQGQCTWYTAVPTIHQIILQRQEKATTAFRFIRSCSSALSPTHWQLLEERYEARVVQAYGLTEASHQMTSTSLQGCPQRTSVGLPTGTELTIRDDRGGILGVGKTGEVCVRGPAVIDHYWQNPQADAASFRGGAFRTGDQGYLDEDGYLYLTGRYNELINRGGERVSPLKVESVLLSNPDVLNAAAFGYPDSIYGEEIAAAVVLRRDVPDGEILAYARERLAAFEVPKMLYPVQHIPTGSSGKVRRRELAQLLGIT